jgi:hypothetical protein
MKEATGAPGVDRDKRHEARKPLGTERGSASEEMVNL